MTWLDNIFPPRIKRSQSGLKKIPEGLWTKCPACDAVLYSSDLTNTLNVCPKCSYHMRINARKRIDLLLDSEGRYDIGQEVLSTDPLKFKDSRKYSDRLSQAIDATGETDALVVVGGSIQGIPVVIACFEFEFMGGSMGSVVGERFVRGVKTALDKRHSFISIAASGGARMQEGLLSLMQMSKTTTAISKLGQMRLPYISVLTDPTMGGVSASFCFLGDVVLAEPGALIGFAGPRVIEQTVRQKLPEGFQRSEFLLNKGAIDQVVDRRQLREVLSNVLSLLLGSTALRSKN